MVVYSKPTYGLDVTTRSVRQTIREQAREGVTSIVISTDLEELLDLCDRIAVISRGRIVGVVENGPERAAAVGELMVGGETATDDLAAELRSLRLGEATPAEPARSDGSATSLARSCRSSARDRHGVDHALAIGVDPIQYYKDVYSAASSSRRGRTRSCASPRSCSSPSA